MSRMLHFARASAFTCPDPSWQDSASEVRTGWAGANDASAISWNELIDDLLRMKSFEDNWDGEGTVAPPQALIDGAIKLAQAFKWDNYSPAQRVVASVNGTVYFEWHTPLGYQEIEVVSPRDAEQRKVRCESDVAEVIRFTF